MPSKGWLQDPSTLYLDVIHGRSITSAVPWVLSVMISWFPPSPSCRAQAEQES